MARTPQWMKGLGGHAGELFVSAELAKRAIPNAPLAEENSFCVFVWLGNTATNEPPRCWITTKRQVGSIRTAHPAHDTPNRGRRFFAETGPGRCQLPPEWRDRWDLLDRFRPVSSAVLTRFEDDANSNRDAGD